MDDGKAKRLLEWLRTHPTAGYQCTELAGVGGSAAVFKATEVKSGKPVAFKVYDTDAGEAAERVDRELGLKGHDCPNLVQIYAGGPEEIDGEARVFLAMEYVEGRDLRALIQPDDRLPDPRIRQLLEQLHRAAAYLLERGVCHRDIKPENIRIRPNGELVLLDLGVLKPVDGSSLTDIGDDRPFIASKRYAPPELQHRREQPNPTGWEAVTVYQIGAVLYELIHGAKLFGHLPDHPPADIISAVDYFDPPVQRSDIGADIVSLARRCLVKQPAERLELATMKMIQKVATSAPPTLAPASGLDGMLHRAATRHELEIRLPTDALKAQQTRAVDLKKRTEKIIAEELHFSAYGLKVTVKDDGNTMVVALPPQLENGFAVEVRICMTVRVSHPTGRVLVSGMGFWGEHGVPKVEQTAAVVRHRTLERAWGPVWDDLMDEIQFRLMLRGWLQRALESLLLRSKDIYEKAIQEERTRIETLLRGESLSHKFATQTREMDLVVFTTADPFTFKVDSKNLR
jgi:hypothetical protein